MPISTSTANVYIIGLKNGPVKIGVTTRKPNKRLLAARRALGNHSAKILWFTSHEEAWLVEKFSHLYLNKYKLSGECFNVSLASAMMAINASIKMLATRRAVKILFNPNWFEKVKIRKKHEKAFLDKINKFNLGYNREEWQRLTDKQRKRILERKTNVRR